ncbi:hypothetical protein [Paenibacillus durus]|uniref:Uncharacterized protein n=1 Tax=Paenibacillus durus TaxID=44251 RepID=A0A089HU94_PAEDU|nr:hypothetical protein [Paenibacillus durus]AIQ14320.1 hypothetical protein PDUR_22250 [Paenibacillus durus]
MLNGLEVTPHASIDDELINYISDTLNWIKAWYPNGSYEKGLDRYGYSIIKEEENIKLFKDIIISWRNLFINAPERIILTGDYGWEVDSIKGFYVKNEFKKQDIIDQISDLVIVVEKALDTKTYVIHYGI